MLCKRWLLSRPRIITLSWSTFINLCFGHTAHNFTLLVLIRIVSRCRQLLPPTDPVQLVPLSGTKHISDELVQHSGAFFPLNVILGLHSWAGNLKKSI